MYRALGRSAAVCAMVLTMAAGCDRGTRPGQIGTPAPEFAVNDGQRSVDLRNLRGHVVVLNFWATWCAPCITELPSLELLQQQLPEVKVIAVATDQDAASYREFLQRRPVPLFTVLDSAQSSNSLYGTFRFPETYVIDKNGVIRRKFIGPQDWTSPEIENSLRQLAS